MNNNVNDKNSEFVDPDPAATMRRAREILAKHKASKEREQDKNDGKDIQPATITHPILNS